MWRKLLTVLACVLLVGATAAANQPVTFVVHGSTEIIAAYEQLFERFTAETGIEVEIMVSGAQQAKWEQVMVHVAGGNSPDIVSGVSTEFGEFAMTGLLRPLDDLIARDGLDTGALVEPFLEALQFQGEQFLLPYGSSLLAMMYNRDHFARAGVAEPPLQWNTPEWTYDQFVDNAKKLTLTDGEGNTTQWGISGLFWDSWITVPYPWGGDWVSEDLTTFRGTEPEAVAALQAFQDLIHSERVMTSAYGTSGFTNGSGSMGGVGTWALQTLAMTPEIDWSFMPWFRVKEHAQAAIFPIGYGILSTSTNQENAWELVKWLTWNEEANLAYATAAGAIPSHLANLQAWREHWESVFPFDINTQVAIDQAVSHAAIIQIRKSPAFWTINPIMTNTSYAVIHNQKPAETALREVAEQIQALLEQAAP